MGISAVQSNGVMPSLLTAQWHCLFWGILSGLVFANQGSTGGPLFAIKDCTYIVDN